MAFRFSGFADEASRDPKEQIAVTKQAGWDSIEVRMINETNVCNLEPDEWGKLWALFQAEGVGIACFGSGLCNWARPITSDFQADVAELKRAIPYMHEAGTRLIRVMSYPNASDEPWPEDKWKKEVFRRLRELAKIAADNDVILAHENCSGYGGIGPDQALEMLAEVNSQAFNLIFDTGNCTSHDQDNESSWRYYEAVKEHIIHVHVKAYKQDADGKWTTCFPDEDPVQRRVFADLEADGYDGWLSIEPHLSAVIHTGKAIDDAGAAKLTYLEYARRLEGIINSL